MTRQIPALSGHVSRYSKCLCIIHVRPVEVDTTVLQVAGPANTTQELYTHATVTDQVVFVPLKLRY